ncbi:MAG TPA: putative peptidoglycan glycosyltransferase FtsW, partial [Vicinamibacterales bacterium]|nr:putative peptidoglycan glycosyltransferase FtsW [Vicinamibacterales bacterium]
EQLIWAMLGVVAVMLVAVLFSREINGSRRWFGVGGFGIQPSELAKLAAIFFAAFILDRRMHRINDLKYALLPIALIVGGLSGLILIEPDFGTAAALSVVVAAMIVAAGLSYRYILGLAVVLLPVAYFVLASADYRWRRIVAFLNPWADPLGDGYHIIQSLIAVGSGGVFGRGLMGGIQKLFYLPEPQTDFIFAVIAEELGLLGATFVLACFGVIAWRGLRAATSAPDKFGAFLAFGITGMVVAQALVNLSVVLSLLPTKGIPLPLVSAGGSSLLVNLASIGVLLNISQHAVHDAAATEPGAA